MVAIVAPLSEAERRSVVIVTALDLETRAVLRHLGKWCDDTVEQGTVFYTGRFHEWDVAVVETGPGNVGVAAIAARAFGLFRPEIALFVGVGGGVKDVALGDVVVATKVYGYEGGKDTATGFAPRPDLHHSAHALEQRARAVAKTPRWRDRLNPDLPGPEGQKLFVGPIAAGEVVVASKKSDTAKFLKKQYGDALAVEMEGRGFLEAVHIHSLLGTVVRGISDLLSKKTVADQAGWQEKAADAASAVAFEILASLNRQSPVPSRTGAPFSEIAKADAKSTETSSKMAARAHRPLDPTVNEGAFYRPGEVLARVGVPDVDEVEFLFEAPPDAYLRIIPGTELAEPIAFAHLNGVAGYAPLLKLKQYGAFTSMNRMGAMAYDPGGAYRGGRAPLRWATQLFQNGEFWLASNTMIVRERGGRPEWVPIPFIPAVNLEAIFFEKAHAAVAFAVQHLSLKFPCKVEMGLVGTTNVALAVDQDRMPPIRKEKIILQQDLADESGVEAALLAFFEQVHDATGFARPTGLFGFPPDKPHA
jgi:nucleoside phosphorylase